MASTFRRTAAAAWLCLFVCAALILSSARAAAPATAPSTAPAMPRIVELRGDATEIGTEHGKLLGESIRGLHEKYLKAYLETDTERFAAKAAAGLFEGKLLPEHRAEVKALAVAAGV